MSDDRRELSEAERRAFDVFGAYLTGSASLESAVSAWRSIDASSPADTTESRDDDEILLGIDPSGFPPDQRDRVDAFMRALEETTTDDF